MRELSRRGAVAVVLATVTAVMSYPPTGANAADLDPSSSAWTAGPVGFASLAGDGVPGTTGGAGGRAVTASTLADLRAYAAATEPLVIGVRGSIEVEPFGDMIPVASDKTIIGVGTGAELVGGGLFLNQTHNVIIRNLTIRDSYLAGDWDGKDPTNDNDGIRLDTANHVWIDHNQIERVGDGLIDIRKDSDFVTLSWNVFGDTNKALGVGWTANLVTKLTAHHNWIRNTYQRNWSIDNVEAAHLFNNYLQDVGLYGTMSRGQAKVVVENSVFERVNDPLVAKDPGSELVERGNLFNGGGGRRDAVGAAFDPAAYYAYQADPATEVAALVQAYAGPKRGHRTPHTPRVVTVALDGTGDYASLLGALGAVRDATVPVTIVVKPGFYREIVNVWNDQPDVTIVGAGRDPRDVVISYDLPAGGAKFYGGTYGSAGSPTLSVLGAGTTVRNLTIENSYDESVTPSQALAVRTVGDRTIFDRTRFIGNQDTYKADSRNRDVVSRTYLHNCHIEGDVDFIYGRGTAVFENCTIRSLDRGSTNNGWVTAASTSDDNPHGFLFVHDTFMSDAAAGTVHLGRPWHPGGDVRALAQVLIRDSVLGAHIAATPWTEMSGFPWQEARFTEYHNTGPGAGATADRPQLDPAEAPTLTRQTYLTGTDNWRPWLQCG